MTPEHRLLQRIVWRSNPTNPISEIQMVSYGIASSSFLAIRCLFELAEKCEDPKIAQIIRKSMLVDDLLHGAHSIKEAARMCELMQILKSG